MSEFVILQHDSPRGEHFDFMLEAGGVLKTWALPRPPTPGDHMPCEALADHRPAYLHYEGEISGGRGTVTQWDHGQYAVVQQSDGVWIVTLAGQKITGQAMLQRSSNNASRWQFAWLAP
jgi:hypothetical protein